MNKTVKTTKIEKKYKDKKTGEYKSLTMNYAKVVDRLNAFRQDNPNSKISTKHQIQQDGSVIFKSYIWKDKADFVKALTEGINLETALYTADSEGTAKSTDDGEKSFEKLETISIGRGLALLGYSVHGEIASSEEMEDFYQFKKTQSEARDMEVISQIQSCKTLDELKDIFMNLNGKDKTKAVIEAKDKRKEELSK